MRIITLRCPNCGTVVAGNVLENHRVMKCPGLDCEEILHFENLDERDQELLVENREKFTMD
jgi:phage FluMu protein Com